MKLLKALKPCMNTLWFGFEVPFRIPIKALSVAPANTDFLSAYSLAASNAALLALIYASSFAAIFV